MYVTLRVMRGGYTNYSPTHAIKNDKTHQGKKQTNAFLRRITWQASNTCIPYRTVPVASVRAHDSCSELKKQITKTRKKKQKKNLDIHTTRPSPRSPRLFRYFAWATLRCAPNCSALCRLDGRPQSIDQRWQGMVCQLADRSGRKLICRWSQPVDTPPPRCEPRGRAEHDSIIYSPRASHHTDEF